LNRLNSRTQQLIGTKQSRHVKIVLYNTEKPKQSEKDQELSSWRPKVMIPNDGGAPSCLSFLPKLQ